MLVDLHRAECSRLGGGPKFILRRCAEFTRFRARIGASQTTMSARVLRTLSAFALVVALQGCPTHYSCRPRIVCHCTCAVCDARKPDGTCERVRSQFFSEDVAWCDSVSSASASQCESAVGSEFDAGFSLLCTEHCVRAAADAGVDLAACDESPQRTMPATLMSSDDATCE